MENQAHILVTFFILQNKLNVLFIDYFAFQIFF